MILYALDTNIRRQTITWIALAAASTATVISLLISQISLPWAPLFTAPSALAVFGVFYYIFDHYLWKKTCFKKIHGLPNICGEWSGIMDRSDVISGKKETDIPILITISQTWSKIDLVLENLDGQSSTGHTRSFVRSATFNIQNPDVKIIRHIWEHDSAKGFSELRLHIDDGVESLEGPFFSAANKNGYIKVEKK